MAGDQWTIGGEFLKWHPGLNLLGFKSCHKLTRLSSRYLRVEDEIRGLRSAYDLNGGTDLLWRILYRLGNRLPLVEAVYGNAAYVMLQPGSRWGLYVTLSGYLVKPLRGGTFDGRDRPPPVSRPLRNSAPHPRGAEQAGQGF